MGLQDRPYYHDDRTGSTFSPQARSMIMNIVIINIALFVIDAFFLNGKLVDIFGVRTWTLLEPWTWWRFLTYGFIHAPRYSFHVIGNMLGLFFLGQDVERLYGGKRFLQMYLTALVICSVVWAIVGEILGQPGALIGASGAVTCVIMLFVLNFPRRTILFMMFIPMPAWVLGVLVILMNIFSFDPASAGAGGEHKIAYNVHLIGAAYGYLFYRTQWSFGSWWSVGGSSFRLPRRRPKLKVHNPESQYTALDGQADVVLDKLHREGQESLTPRERKILEDYSRRMKQKHR